LFIILFLSVITNGQTTQQIASLRKPFIANNYPTITPTLHSASDTIKSHESYTAPFRFMASKYYTSTIGFFCRKEIDIEKALNIPLKFRLGSVAYTDEMEGKGAGVLPVSGKR
jgi:hypothetical protein